MTTDQTTTAIVKRVDARHIMPGDHNDGYGGDVTIQTYDGREVLVNVGMIKSYIQIPDDMTDFELTAFVQFCVTRGYDPFARQCYPIRYQKGKPISFVVSWNVYLDRASRHPMYDGLESGIVWEVKHPAEDEGDEVTTEIVHGQPCEYDPSADNVRMVGGWARVHRKDRKFPTYVEVPIHEMQNQSSSTWRNMTTTMMTKTPSARGLRMTFPEELGHSYADGEIVAEPTPEAVDVPTREVRAERDADGPAKTVQVLALDVELAMEADGHATCPTTTLRVLKMLAARATGRNPEEFDDDSAWTPEVVYACEEILTEHGIDPEWLPGEDVPSE